MTEDKLISIIIPTYNREDFIEEALYSIIAQTYANWECLVIDDGSTDETKKRVLALSEKDPRILYYLRPESIESGGNGARNYGFSMSNGKFINWFDSDDLMLPNFLESKIEAFNKQVDLVLCEGYEFDAHNKSSKHFEVVCKTDLFKDYVFWKSHIITDSVMFRRSFLKGKKLFNPEISRGQEADFFSRLFYKLKDEQWAVIKKPLFKYRIHSGSKSTMDKTYNKPFKASQSKIAFENLQRGIELKDKAIIQYCYRLLANFFFRALEHDHQELSSKILGQILPILKQLNKRLWLQWVVLGNLFLRLRRGSYKIEMYLKTYKIF